MCNTRPWSPAVMKTRVSSTVAKHAARVEIRLPGCLWQRSTAEATRDEYGTSEATKKAAKEKACAQSWCAG